MQIDIKTLAARISALEEDNQSLHKKCEVFQMSVNDLIEHARLNTEAIVEHIAQLDTEKAEIINEYKVALNQLYTNTKQQLDDLVNEKRKSIL